MRQSNAETEAALDRLEKAMLAATLADEAAHRNSPLVGKPCPTCGKPFEPGHGSKAGDYSDDDIPF